MKNYRVKCGVCGLHYKLMDNLLEEGEASSLTKCPFCGTVYIAVNFKAFQLPQLYKLTRTKAHIFEEVVNESGVEGDISETDTPAGDDGTSASVDTGTRPEDVPNTGLHKE